ncbi:MAG: hypothetical protein K2I70_03740, partial [Bacilli bacterium]|nr:hypothetical protein [Bacilli bacterium]
NSLFYVLGFEQLIEGTGTGSKTLSQALTKQIRIDDETNGEELPVLESEIQAEISNGKEVKTIRRFAKHEKKKDNLITVFHSTIENMYLTTTSFTDMYVLMPGAARNEFGFHRFLEDFLEMNLPQVTNNNGSEVKLYLQTVFSALFIEQKHGWGGVLNGVPYLGIAEVKKRVVEFILGLSTLANEKTRKKLKQEEDNIIRDWKQNCATIEQLANDTGIGIEKMPNEPTLSGDEIGAIRLVKDNIDICSYIDALIDESNGLTNEEPRVNVENRAKVESELSCVQSDIEKKEIALEELRSNRKIAKLRLDRTKESLEIIQTDLLNNKEVKRLRELGAEQGINDFDNICPTCGQKINDSLLNDKTVMSIEENIIHLQNQEILFLFTEQAQQKAIDNLDNTIQCLENEIRNLKQLYCVLRDDIIKVKDDYSYAMTYKKVKLDLDIENLNKVFNRIQDNISKFSDLSNRWKNLLDEKSKIGDKNIGREDDKTLDALGSEFVKLLEDFGYKSTQHFNLIKISRDTFLPTINGFDMRYDSSASDELRNVWAFSLALMKTAQSYSGNH